MPTLAAHPKHRQRHLGAFDVPATAVELSQRGMFDRVMFAGIYAFISLLALPWFEVAGWDRGDRRLGVP